MEAGTGSSRHAKRLHACRRLSCGRHLSSLLAAALIGLAYLITAGTSSNPPPSSASSVAASQECMPVPVWSSARFWKPLCFRDRLHHYVRSMRYRKYWKERKEVLADTLTVDEKLGDEAPLLKDALKYIGADFFNDSKLREMAQGALELNLPAFRENRELIASRDGGLDNPSVLVFYSGWKDRDAQHKTKPFKYPLLPQVRRPSNEEDIAFMDVLELGTLIRTKQISSQALTDIFLLRLKRYNPILEAVITFTDDLAFEQAKNADELLEHGIYLG